MLDGGSNAGEGLRRDPADGLPDLHQGRGKSQKTESPSTCPCPLREAVRDARSVRQVLCNACVPFLSEVRQRIDLIRKHNNLWEVFEHFGELLQFLCTEGAACGVAGEVQDQQLCLPSRLARGLQESLQRKRVQLPPILLFRLQPPHLPTQKVRLRSVRDPARRRQQKLCIQTELESEHQLLRARAYDDVVNFELCPGDGRACQTGRCRQPGGNGFPQSQKTLNW
mmetsp:Transcript_48035/g.94880  ORF Transcript_48035/g.94880 Transcript_48035/m.94880 type:complete len:225 (+) Transcript_48035:694-1368(+)